MQEFLVSWILLGSFLNIVTPSCVAYYELFEKWTKVPFLPLNRGEFLESILTGAILSQCWILALWLVCGRWCWVGFWGAILVAPIALVMLSETLFDGFQRSQWYGIFLVEKSKPVSRFFVWLLGVALFNFVAWRLMPHRVAMQLGRMDVTEAGASDAVRSKAGALERE